MTEETFTPVPIDVMRLLDDMHQHDRNQLIKAKEEFPSILETLREAGVTDTVNISFSGYGDEGAIDYIEGIPTTGDADKDRAIEEKVSRWADVLATHTGWDWWNNEGGQGTLDISVKDSSFDLSIDQAERVFTNVFNGHYQEGLDAIQATPLLGDVE